MTVYDLVTLLSELCATLPKCDSCTDPATKAFRRGEGRWCDAHAPQGCPDYPRAAALRKAAAALRGEPIPGITCPDCGTQAMGLPGPEGPPGTDYGIESLWPTGK